MVNAEEIGKKIAQLRKENGLTQKELAARLNVTDKAVSKWNLRMGTDGFYGCVRVCWNVDWNGNLYNLL